MATTTWGLEGAGRIAIRDRLGRSRTRPLGAFLALAAALLVAVATVPTPAVVRDGATVSVIVRKLPGAGNHPERSVEALGSHVERHIGIIDGFVAEVPESGLARLEGLPGVHSVTPDASVRLTAEPVEYEEEYEEEYEGEDDTGSMFAVTREVTGAGEYWEDGHTGQGVDIALIDSGVVPVNGLTVPGKVINGADLSFESQAPNLRYLDTYGHGTHMAGIMAGRDDESSFLHENEESFLGMAPDARIVNVKVADSSGAVDVSQVIAAIDWVVQHRTDNGMNIRVLNLSFGTDGVQNYRLDPLAYAAEVAWRKGIVVVVAAGNRGYGSAKLNNPAYDPYVIAVGAADGNGTDESYDDSVPSFSSCGDAMRAPDLVAPGKSVVSLRAPGSAADVDYPGGRVNDRFFRGSGTSQAAAVVSGAAALIISQRPEITPDQVKALLTSTASPIPESNSQCAGAGMLNLRLARETPTPEAWQHHAFSNGRGSLELSRGSAHLVDGEIPLSGEKDIFGTAWYAKLWAAKSWSGTSWSGGLWNGKSWSGESWSESSWAGTAWAAKSWSRSSWSGKSWSSVIWSGKSWSWSGKSWSGGVWTDYGWSAKSWSSNLWSGIAWS